MSFNIELGIAEIPSLTREYQAERGGAELTRRKEVQPSKRVREVRLLKGVCDVRITKRESLP